MWCKTSWSSLEFFCQGQSLPNFILLKLVIDDKHDFLVQVGNSQKKKKIKNKNTMWTKMMINIQFDGVVSFSYKTVL